MKWASHETIINPPTSDLCRDQRLGLHYCIDFLTFDARPLRNVISSLQSGHGRRKSEKQRKGGHRINIGAWVRSSTTERRTGTSGRGTLPNKLVRPLPAAPPSIRSDHYMGLRLGPSEHESRSPARSIMLCARKQLLQEYG